MKILNERKFSIKKRKELIKKKKALSDGSFPIENKKDLKNAIKSYGLSKNKYKAKKWIIKRAKELNIENELPDKWLLERKILRFNDFIKK